MEDKIIVIGGSGSMGFKICKSITELLPGTHLIVGDYKLDRGIKTAKRLTNASARHADINDFDSLEKLMSIDISCVVVALKQKDPIIQNICSKKNIPCVDITTFSAFSNKVKQQLPIETSVSVIMAGFFPGMSGIAVKEGMTSFSHIDQVKVSLLQNSKASVGITGMRDMLTIISRPLEKSKGFRKRYRVKIESKEYYPREINHDESLILEDCLMIPSVTYYTCWNKEFFNKFISLIIRSNTIKPLIKLMRVLKINMDRETNNETAYLSVEFIGNIRGGKQTEKKIQLKVFSDYGITAWMTALLVKKILVTPFLVGVCYPFEILTFEDVLVLEKYGKLEYLR